MISVLRSCGGSRRRARALVESVAPGLTVNLGPTENSKTYQLAIGYEGNGHVLSVGLYTDQGIELATVSADGSVTIESSFAPGPAILPELPRFGLQMTCLGWRIDTFDAAADLRSDKHANPEREQDEQFNAPQAGQPDANQFEEAFGEQLDQLLGRFG